MIKTDKPLLNLLQGKPFKRHPLWMMRQAGRYLPEYRAIRSQMRDFLDLCYTPEMAAEVTLQPLRRFDFDAAILFADILLLPHALGQKLAFVEGEGPKLEPIREDKDLIHLSGSVDRLEPVFETASRVQEALGEDQVLLGFAGGIWTVACYMIEGGGHKPFPIAMSKLTQDPAFLDKLIDRLIETTMEYLGRQVEAGAETVLLFDSWAGLLTGDMFSKYVIEPTKSLVRALKQEYPKLPVMGFPRGASEEDYLAFAQQTGVDGMIADPALPRSFIRDQLSPLLPIQGNMDPALLKEGGPRMLADLDDMIGMFGNQRHIFSTGHGILPQTPPEHIEAFIRVVRAWEQENNGRSDDEKDSRVALSPRRAGQS